ncbi:unnamed protein product [Allacma fusca]|uniref:28S ribosomal protein S14, mitochondrial n=1 Tax=Allacma fusca TaxID=39272 RepID=A0A8J2NWN9_9HEXA|nr:unnamed protein product [Allacma fusca]
MSVLTGFVKNLFWSPALTNGVMTQPVRHKWTDWRMLKDYKKRQMMIKLNPERQRINTIRKNDILPRELREMADKEIADLPRDSSITRIVARCAITSRPRPVYKSKYWHVSRIAFRHLADYNKLAGVQRGLW